MTPPYRYCEFRHLMTPVTHPEPIGTRWAHVHEDDALVCALFVAQGWPDPREAVS